MKIKQKLSIILFSLFLPFYNIFAQTLENIPGQTPTDSDLTVYLNNIYKFGISITGILAIFMVGLGAFTYIVTSAGNSFKMINAKETIYNALFGLAIALTAYLLLYVINPDLVGGTLGAPEALMKKAVETPVSHSTASPLGKIADGTECNSQGGSIGTVTCPTCPNCQQECANGYYYNMYTKKAFCGLNPSATPVINGMNLPDGTECNSQGPTGVTCPTCPNCQQECANGYYYDMNIRKAFCGSRP